MQLARLALILFILLAAPRAYVNAATLLNQTSEDAALLALWPSDLQHRYELKPAVTLAQVTTLVHAGANVNEKGKDGQMPLMRASAFGNLDIVVFLVSKGAKVNAGDTNGTTALMDACFTSRLACAKYLLSKGAIVDQKDNGGDTALLNECDALMEESMAADADNGGQPVRVVAGQSGELACLKLLIAHGANVNAIDSEQATPLTLAASGDANGNVEAVTVLVEHGANVNTQDGNGNSALMLASLANPDEVKFLLAKGAKVNAIDGDGQTALFWASKSGSLNCINELLLAGADSTIKDKAGQTAVDVAHDPSTADELRGNAN